MYSSPCPYPEQASIVKTGSKRAVIIGTISVHQRGAPMNSKTNDRRGFLNGLIAAGGLAAAAHAQPVPARSLDFLPFYTRAQNYKSLKQSSFDRTGGNSDRWPVAPGGVQEVFNAEGPGVITHIWFTIAAGA